MVYAERAPQPWRIQAFAGAGAAERAFVLDLKELL